MATSEYNEVLSKLGTNKIGTWYSANGHKIECLINKNGTRTVYKAGLVVARNVPKANVDELVAFLHDHDTLTEYFISKFQ